MSDTRIRLPKATDLLQEDHRELKRLFKEYGKLDPDAPEPRDRILEELRRELTTHLRIEEEIFYPAVADAEDEEDAAGLVDEAQEAHRSLRTLLEEIEELGPEDEAFDARMNSLRESFDRHVEQAEREIFPIFRGLDEDARDEVSERLRDRKREIENE